MSYDRSPDERSLHVLDADCDVPLTTGDMARRSGSTLRTVRFYEQEGLITPECRSDGGHRLFDKRQLDRLRLALDLRASGLTIQDVKHLFDVKSRCETPEQASDEVRSIIEAQVDSLQEKIATLRRLREELTHAMTVISECKTCDDAQFPRRCANCDVLERPSLPRAVRVLWS